MKIGNYDLGTPIEVGITGDNQFYYPVYHGAPLYSNDYDCDELTFGCSKVHEQPLKF